MLDEVPVRPELPLGPNGERFAWCSPLVEGYCVPRTFRIYLEVTELDCIAVLWFVSGWENSIVHERGLRSRYPLQQPAPRKTPTKAAMPWAELERIALAWAAVPVPLEIDGWKRMWTIGQVGSADSDLFGTAFDVVYPQLRLRRKPRVSERDAVRAARIHRGLPDDEPRKLSTVARELHVSEGTVKRRLKEYRKRHPDPLK
jgi:hypothetical protein